MSRFVTPYVIEIDEKGREKEYHIGARLLKERIIMVSGVVDEDMSYIVISQLLHLASISDDPIMMYINSPGGSVMDGLPIIDTMKAIKPKVGTLVTGWAASMGAALLSSGEPGMRYALLNSQIMVHQVSSGTRGHVEDMRISYEHAAFLNVLLMQMLANNCGMTHKQLLEAADRDRWLTSKEGLTFGKKGIIDKIITTFGEVV